MSQVLETFLRRRGHLIREIIEEVCDSYFYTVRFPCNSKTNYLKEVIISVADELIWGYWKKVNDEDLNFTENYVKNLIKKSPEIKSHMKKVYHNKCGKEYQF